MHYDEAEIKAASKRLCAELSKLAGKSDYHGVAARMLGAVHESLSLAIIREINRASSPEYITHALANVFANALLAVTSGLTEEHREIVAFEILELTAAMLELSFSGAEIEGGSERVKAQAGGHA